MFVFYHSQIANHITSEKKKLKKKTFFSKFAKNNLEFKFHPTNSFVLLEQLSKSS